MFRNEINGDMARLLGHIAATGTIYANVASDKMEEFFDEFGAYCDDSKGYIYEADVWNKWSSSLTVRFPKPKDFFVSVDTLKSWAPGTKIIKRGNTYYIHNKETIRKMLNMGFRIGVAHDQHQIEGSLRKELVPNFRYGLLFNGIKSFVESEMDIMKSVIFGELKYVLGANL